MKKIVLIICSYLIGCLWGCNNKVVDWQTETDSIAPGTVFDVQIENLPGAAKLIYSLPEDEDLLLVEAIYTINGKQLRTSASAYTNSLTVYGFGSSDVQTIQLYCVDRSRNYSQAVNVQINPLTPPVLSIFESIKMSATFGGVFLQWENPTKADVSIWILAADSTGVIKDAETMYTNATSGKFKLRGFDNMERIFGVYVRDRWNNLSDTLYASLIPYYEEFINPTPFKKLALPRDEEEGTKPFSRMFDGDISTHMYTSATVNLSPVFFTIDLGQTVILSRYKLWHHPNIQYASCSPKIWKIYGTLEPNMSNTDTNYWENGYQNDWILLSDVDNISLYKPSGDELNHSDEDKSAATKGFDFEFINNSEPVRYIRFEITENWVIPVRCAIGELEFYGTQIN